MIAALLLVLNATTAPPPPKNMDLGDGRRHVFNVTVDGLGYTVRVKGEEVKVWRRGVMALRNFGIEDVDRMRRAVTMATPCAVSHEFVNPEYQLVGRIAC